MHLFKEDVSSHSTVLCNITKTDMYLILPKCWAQAPCLTHFQSLNLPPVPAVSPALQMRTVNPVFRELVQCRTTEQCGATQ